MGVLVSNLEMLVSSVPDMGARMIYKEEVS